MTESLLPYLGGIILIISLALIVTALVGVVLGDGAYAPTFLIPAVASGLVGSALYRPWGRPTLPPLILRDSVLVLVVGWAAAFLISAWPFSMGNLLPYRLALFESISGWTTTGLSVLDVSSTPRIYLLWRSIMQYMGGAGFAIAMLSSILGPTGAAISRAEGRQEVLPMVRRSAETIGAIYISYGVLAAFGLRLLGMQWFHAVNHAMAALSTGGFSTVDASLGAWSIRAIHLFTLLLMFLGNTNFITHHHLLSGRWRRAVANPEFRVFLMLGGAAFLITLAPVIDLAGGEAGFQIVSALTTTGFSTVDISQWSEASLLVIVLLMIVGGGVNSTAGGIKQRRVYLMFKSISWQIREDLLPQKAVVSHSIRDHGDVKNIDVQELRRSANLVALFLATLLLSTAAIALAGYPLTESLFEATSALGTVGLSVGITSAEAPPVVLWILKASMFLGRLELFAVLMAIRRILKSPPKI